MKERLKLTPEQIAYAKARYRPHFRGRSALAIARELGISRDGLLRNLDPGYREKRNASARKSYHHVSNGRRPGPLSKREKYIGQRAKITLPPVKTE